MNRQLTIEQTTASQLKDAKTLPPYSVGDTIDVHYKIIEGDKERIQVFQGVLLAKTGRGAAVFAALQQRGVITRPMGSYGLSDWLRISVGTPAENARCLIALREVLATLPAV